MSGRDPAAMLPVVADIVVRVTGRAQAALAMQTPLHAIDGLDSLRLLETVALAEEHFGVAVETGGFGALETLGDVVRLVAAGRAQA